MDLYSSLFADQEETAPSIVLPAALEAYLAPDLWRRLSRDPTRRGLLLNALESLRSTLYLLGTHLPTHLVQDELRRTTLGQARGSERRGSLLFADVSGFTALSERLATLGQEGAEQLTTLMNGYFEAMLEILAWSGGDLLKFAGDAMLVFFAEQPHGEQARWATRAARRMMGAMGDFAALPTPLGPVALRMKIGIATGSFLAANVGDAERMEYVVLGPAVRGAMAAEGAAEAGLVVVDEATAALLPPAATAPRAPAFFAVLDSPDEPTGAWEIRAESRRARGGISLNASPRALLVQMEIALRQLQSLRPYLPAPLAERVVSRARQRHVESEFRPVTVMFANVIGLEALLDGWGAAGPRRVAGLTSDFFSEVQRAVATRDGIVSRIDPYSKGSKLLILFGAPAAHEDDPQRAVSAALAMQAAMAGLARRWRSELARFLPDDAPDPLVTLRIGITQGVVFAGQVGAATRREYTVMGDEVNLAARLMGAAQPGQILIHDRLAALVRDQVRSSALEPIRVKGKSNPIPIFQVEGEWADPLARRLAAREPMIGRDEAWAEAQGHLERALAGRGTLLSVRGAAGMGKSLLLLHLAAEAQARGAQLLTHTCRPYDRDAPYSAWLPLLRRLLAVESSAPLEAQGEALHQALTALALPLAEMEGPLATLLGVRRWHPPVPLAPTPPPAPARPSLFQRLGSQLEENHSPATPAPATINLWQMAGRQAQGQPTPQAGGVWQRLQGRMAMQMEQRLVAAVERLLRRLADDQPLVLLFDNVQWLDRASRALLSHLADTVGAARLLLVCAERSDEGAAAAQGATLRLEPFDRAATQRLAEALADGPLPAPLLDRLHTWSEGNPFFVAELVAWWQREGGVLADDAPPPSGIQQPLLSRVDSLPAPPREAIRRAAVAGSDFWRRELAALGEAEREGEPPDDALTTLSEGRLLLSEFGDEPRFFFRQLLVREVLYASMAYARRRSLHSALALFLEAGQRAAPARLAHHFEQARRWLPAARYGLRAAQEARARYALPEAQRTFEWVLATLGKLSSRQRGKPARRLEADAHEGLGDVALLRGEWRAALAAYGAAQAALPAGDAARVPRLAHKRALLLPTQGRAAQAQALLPDGGDAATLALRAWLLWRAGDEGGTAAIQAARAALPTGQDEWAQGVAALLALWAGEWGVARRTFDGISHTPGVALALLREGVQAAHSGEWARAAQRLDEAAATWQGAGDGGGMALAHFQQAALLEAQGDAGASAARLDDAAALLAAAPVAGASAAIAAARAAPGEPARWPRDGWQSYEDGLVIPLLFRAE